MVSESSSRKEFKAQIRISKCGETARGMPTLRKGRLVCDTEKKELSLVFETPTITKCYPFSTVVKLPKAAPKQKSLTLCVRPPGSETMEVYCEFSTNGTMVELFQTLQAHLPNAGVPGSAGTMRSRGLFQNRVGGNAPAQREAAQKVSSRAGNIDSGWNRVPQMESSLCGTSFVTPVRSSGYKPSSVSRSTTSRLRTASLRDSLSDSSKAKRARIYETLSDENENPALNAVTSEDFYGTEAATSIIPESTPVSAKSKTSRCSRSLLRDITMHKDNSIFAEISPIQKAMSVRRRICGVDDALLCQSPGKSPVVSQTSQLSSPGNELQFTRGGFANLGNTCYMNAILQAICNVDEFSKELYRLCCRAQKIGLFNEDDVAMMFALSNLISRRLKASRTEQRHMLETVKSAVKNDAMRFSGYHQEDAQEFLSQVLDQVKEESTAVLQKVAEVDGDRASMLANPVTANFSFTLRHEIKCESCSRVVNRSENAIDLPMHLPIDERAKWNVGNETFCSVQTLFDDCLEAEQVECRCEACGSNRAEISHKFEKLPRCLVVYFKRYTFDASMVHGEKRKDSVAIPLYLTLQGHCFEETAEYAAVPPSVKKIDFAQIRMENEKLPASLAQKPARRRLNPETPGTESVQSCTPPTSPVPALSSSPTELGVDLVGVNTTWTKDAGGRSPVLNDVPAAAKKNNGVDLSLMLCSPGRSPERDSIMKGLLDIGKKKTACERQSCVSTSATKRSLPLTIGGDRRSNQHGNIARKTLTTDELNCMSEEDQIKLALEKSILEKARLGSDDMDLAEDDFSTATIPQQAVEGLDDGSVAFDSQPGYSDTSSSAERQGQMEVAEVCDLNGNMDVDPLNNNNESDAMEAFEVYSPTQGSSFGYNGGEGSADKFLTASKSGQFVNERRKKSLVGGDVIGLNFDTAFRSSSPEACLADQSEEEGIIKDSQSLPDTTKSLMELSTISCEAKIDGKARSIPFKPVGRSWRIGACEALELMICSGDEDLFEENPAEMEISILDAPLRCAPVKADGNCLFRALAYYITGGYEEQYVLLRQKVVEFENEYSDTFRALKGWTEQDWIEHLETMACDANWGSDLELAAIATLLGTEVWTYYESMWYCYRPRFTVDSDGNRIDISPRDYCFGKNAGLYLANRGSHYTPVLEVSNSYFLVSRKRQQRLSSIAENAEKGGLPPSYRLLSVISHLGGTSQSGHYVCDVWNRKDGCWLHCDDSSITEVTENEVRQQRTTTGYIFFYIASELLNEKPADGEHQ